MKRLAVIDPVDLSAAETVAALRDLRSQLRTLQANELLLLGHYADLNTVTDQPASEADFRFGEQLVELGHDGTPKVADFAALELAAALGEPREAAEAKLGEALDLRHRHPSLWALVLGGGLKKWLAAEVAQRARKLDRHAVAELDRRMGLAVPTVGIKRVLQLAKAWILELTPEDQRLSERQQAQRSRKVSLAAESFFGVTEVTAIMDAGDALTLDQQVGQIAHLLLLDGRTESLNERRALALGLLARPAQALAFLQAGAQGMLPVDLDGQGECGLIGQPGHTCGQVTVDPDKLLPKAELVLHLTDATLQTGDGLVRCDKLGPLMLSWLTNSLGGRRFTVRPVLDPAAIGPVDSYEIPPAMREAVLLRSPYEAFPGSCRPASRLDLDHTVPYATNGPPGQTRQDNLAPLTRKVHRAKTFGRWKTVHVLPGILLWQSPLGYSYLCTPSGSWCVDAPEGLASTIAA